MTEQHQARQRYDVCLRYADGGCFKVRTLLLVPESDALEAARVRWQDRITRRWRSEHLGGPTPVVEIRPSVNRWLGVTEQQAAAALAFSERRLETA